MIRSTTLEVVGEQRLACEGCENRVARLLKAVEGVARVRASASNQRIEVQFDPARLNASALAKRLRSAGYETRVAAQTHGQAT